MAIETSVFARDWKFFLILEKYRGLDSRKEWGERDERFKK